MLIPSNMLGGGKGMRCLYFAALILFMLALMYLGQLGIKWVYSSVFVLEK
jgi:hypothetical protein